MIIIKKTIYGITAIIMLLLTINQAIATDWYQYTTSPVSNQIDYIFSLSNGKGFGYTSGANFLRYNGTMWSEISAPAQPSPLPTKYNTFVGVDKTNDGYIHIMYFATSDNSVAIIRYDASTNTYSLEKEYTAMGCAVSRTFQCDETTNTCYANCGGDMYGGGNFYQLTPTYSSLYNGTIISLLPSDDEIYGLDYGDNPYYWNGISWQSAVGAGVGNIKFIHRTSTQKGGVDTSTVGFNQYNSTSGTYSIPRETSSSSGVSIGSNFYLSRESDKAITKCDWSSYSNCTIDASPSVSMYSMDYDATAGLGWAGGASGIIYQYGTGGGGGTGTYTVTPRIVTSPTSYGDQVIFYGTATEPTNLASNLTLEIWDITFSSLIYTTTINNVDSGLETELYRLPTSSGLWGAYPVGNYIYNLQATVIDNSQTLSNSTLWIVNNPSTTNTTTYSAICYQKDITGINGIYSVSTYDENNAYTSAQNTTTSKPTIASFDTTNNQNIITSLYNTTLNLISGINGVPSSISTISISQGLERLYVGTNNDLFVFTGAENKLAETLNYETDNGFGILENDGINDVSATTNTNISYVCQDGSGLENDDVYKYINNNQTYTDKMNINPCRDIISDGNIIYIHRGTNRDVQIWNSTTLSQISSIDITKTISTLSYADLMSINNNYLFIIAGTDEIRRYDITNKSNPTIASKCFTANTGDQITSIEVINDNEIIYGTVDVLYVCDFNNSETYDTIKGGYEGQAIAPILYNQAWEITKNNNEGKLSIAEGNGYEICYYTKSTGTITAPNPPIISQITKTTSTPCLNQNVQLQIIASDPDPTDYLGYAYNCNGGIPTSYMPNNYLFTCTYTSTGIKTISVGAQDNHGATTTSSTIVNVQNCTQNQSTTILMRIIDSGTGNAIQGATATLINITSGLTINTQTTDSLGYADFTSLNYEQYRVSYTKSGYIPTTQYFYPSDSRYTRWLDPINGTTTQAVLIIMVYDKENNPLETALIGATDIITGESRSTLTDYTGAGYILGITPSDKLLISASKTGYTTSSTYTSIGTGEEKIVTIIMGVTSTGTFDVTNRGCEDTIKGVLLCGNLTITGIGNTCTQDTDCITGLCGKSMSGLNRECSKFNWTICDNQGMNRGNKCYMRATGMGFVGSFGNFILENFLYVLLFIAILIIFLMIVRAVKR